MSTTNYGRFSERLKKIARSKKKVIKIEDSKTIYTNFLKVSAAIPLMIYENIKDTATDTKDNQNKEQSPETEKKGQSREQKLSNSQTYEEKLATLKTKKTFPKIKNNKLVKKPTPVEVIQLKEAEKKQPDEKNIKELEKKIINLIKKDLIKTVNELEILQSELYILTEFNHDDALLRKCRANIDEVKSIICKIDKLKKKYDYLKDTYDFEYIVEYGDNELIDNIITLKNYVETPEIKTVISDYKLLDVYKYLYLRIDKIHNDTIEFSDYKEKEAEKLKQRDIDFEKIKNKAYDLEKINSSYERFVKDQEEILKEVYAKVGIINETEKKLHKLTGISSLILPSLRYIGLLMINPLKGVIPSIVTETIIARNVITNLNRNVRLEEKHQMEYSTIDCRTEISSAIDNIDKVGSLVDETLENIVNLKIRYNEEFKKYQGDIAEYENVIGKINDMENKIMGNKIKIEIIRKQLQEKEKHNIKVLKQVDEQNHQSKPY